MPRLKPGPGRPRAAFTLIELLIVLAIMSVLVALLAAAVFKTMGAMQDQATDTTLSKVASELSKQWSIVVQQANQETPSPSVVALAGGDARRARVIWVKLRLKQEFPMTYAEALNPGGGIIPASELPPKNAYRKALASLTGTPNPRTESSALLLLSLTSGRGGMRWDAEATLGAGFVHDTDGDSLAEILDTWHNPIYFVRYPIDWNPAATPLWAQDMEKILNQEYPLPGGPPPRTQLPWVRDLNPGGLQSGSTNDAQDPEGLLSNPTWASTNSGILFGQLCHPVGSGVSYVNLAPFVASAGADGSPPSSMWFNGDDRFSYRLKKAGAGGDQ
jgi:prepilin-type N-terminal cleavage/methylation domain-containing protein